MERTRRDQPRPEKRLGILAMRFRCTKDEAERRRIATDYSRAVTRLINSRK
jgi:hypothetical protein